MLLNSIALFNLLVEGVFPSYRIDNIDSFSKPLGKMNVKYTVASKFPL